jgi:hypothetical protein
MRDGLYKVQFQTPRGMGTGVVYAQAGKMWGGDAALYYVGTYTQSGENLSAHVETNRHSQVPGVVPVFGIDKVTIKLEGSVKGDTVTCQGTAAQAPSVTFQAVLNRISD